MDFVFTILVERCLPSVCRNHPSLSNPQTATDTLDGTPQRFDATLEVQKQKALIFPYFTGVQDSARIQPQDFQQSGAMTVCLLTFSLIR